MVPNLHEFSELIRWINTQGWSPATSTNYSIKASQGDHPIWISRSGVDKVLFKQQDFISMNLNGILSPEFTQIKPSAETELHLEIYRQTDAHVILHTHSKADTLLSRLVLESSPQQTIEIKLSQYELLKGLRGVNSHDVTISIPCFPNTQNIPSLARALGCYLEDEQDCLGFLIGSHGFYTWGSSLDEAKRHLEVFQFLFDCELSLKLATTAKN